MKPQIYFILILFSVSCICKEVDPFSYDLNFKSVDGGLISIQKDFIYLHENDKITRNDANGNYLNNSISFNRDLYNTFELSDSIITLIGPRYSNLFKLDSNAVYKPLSRPNPDHSFHPKYSYKLDTTIAILNGFYNDNSYNVINFYKFKNDKIITIHNSDNNNIKAYAFTEMQDSLIFTLENQIKQFNIHQPQVKPEIHNVNISSEKYMANMFSENQFLYVSNGVHIYLYEKMSNGLQFLSKSK